MQGRTVRWLVAGFGIAIAAGVVVMVIEAVRRGRPAVEECAGSETHAPDLRLVPSA